MMKLRNKLDELGKMEGVSSKEKGQSRHGGSSPLNYVCSLQILRNS